MTARELKFDPELDEIPENEKREISIEIAGEHFELVSDLTAVELLTAVASTAGGPGSTKGILDFLHRVIGPDGSPAWDRFSKVSARWKPQHFGQLAGDLMAAYSENPTGSSDGSSSTGSTSE